VAKRAGAVTEAARTAQIDSTVECWRAEGDANGFPDIRINVPDDTSPQRAITRGSTTMRSARSWHTVSAYTLPGVW